MVVAQAPTPDLHAAKKIEYSAFTQTRIESLAVDSIHDLHPLMQQSMPGSDT